MRRSSHLREPPAVKALLIVAALALRRPDAPAAAWARCSPRRSKHGATAWLAAVTEPDARSAIRLTLLVAAIAVPLNMVFGIAAAWAIAKYDFRGKTAAAHADRTALLGLAGGLGPGVRPAVRRAGLVRRMARRSATSRSSSRCPGSCSRRSSSRFPFVARQLIPLMTAQGRADEEAALTLGASGWQTFWHVTLPNIRFGCSTACCCATPARWASLARSALFPDISAARPTPCRFTSRCFTMSTTLSPPSPLPRSSPSSPSSLLLSKARSSGATATRSRPRL